MKARLRPVNSRWGSPPKLGPCVSRRFISFEGCWKRGVNIHEVCLGVATEACRHGGTRLNLALETFKETRSWRSVPGGSGRRGTRTRTVSTPPTGTASVLQTSENSWRCVFERCIIYRRRRFCNLVASFASSQRFRS